MKRFRLGTLMLLVVIAALGLGIMLQELRHWRREARLEAENTQMREWIAKERASKSSITAINEETLAYWERKKKEATSANKDANH